ncbi:UNVERIFIED_CONTAM: hypothetical protein FKN15_067507 [Acipenser sinensis]
MSFLPKSESKTSLLKSAAAGRKTASHSVSGRRINRHPGNHSGRGGGGGRAVESDVSGGGHGEPRWPADGDASTRRPLCHPWASREHGARQGSGNESHATAAPGNQPDQHQAASGLSGQEQSKTSKHHHHRHHHHHHRHHNHHHHPAPGHPPPQHIASDPGQPDSLSTAARQSKRKEDMAREKSRAGSTLSLASDHSGHNQPQTPSSSPLAKSSSRASGKTCKPSTRAGAAETDSSLPHNLRPILNPAPVLTGPLVSPLPSAPCSPDPSSLPLPSAPCSPDPSSLPSPQPHAHRTPRLSPPLSPVLTGPLCMALTSSMSGFPPRRQAGSSSPPPPPPPPPHGSSRAQPQ